MKNKFILAAVVVGFVVAACGPKKEGGETNVDSAAVAPVEAPVTTTDSTATDSTAVPVDSAAHAH